MVVSGMESLQHTGKGLDRGNWLALRSALARGHLHARQSGSQPWTPRDASAAGIERLLRSAIAIARFEMPADFTGTRLDPAKLNRLGADVCLLLDLLDRMATVGATWTAEHAAFAKVAAQLVEPFVAKLLARCASGELVSRANDRLDLSRLLKYLHQNNRSPFDPKLLDMKEAAFATAVGGDSWNCLSWSLWSVMRARIDASHLAATIDLMAGLSTLWCTAVVLLSITEKSVDLIDESGGRLPPKYRTLRKLGEGGMGEVFLAVDEVTGSNRAIKVLRIADGGSSSARSALRHEACALERLADCRRVVRYHDIVELDTGFALVMAYVEGENLQEELEHTKALELKDAVSTTIDVLSALEEIHSAGLVHRDVKPSNFIRTSTGIIAIDFGLSRPLGANLTQTARAGSDRYVAPEQLEGRADHRSDLYAAGRLLYALLSGGPPVHDSDTLERANPEVSSELENFYRKATARNPDDRYQSADEMRAALESTRGIAIPELRDSLTPGYRWGNYHVERCIAQDPEQSWTLVKARRRGVFAARSRLLWVQHGMDDLEQARILPACAALLELPTSGIQSLDEIVEDPSHAFVLEEPPPTSLAEVMRRCAASGRRLSPTCAINLVWEVAIALGDLHTRLGSRREEADGAGRAGGVNDELLWLLRVWPPGIRISHTGGILLSLFELLRDLRRGTPTEAPAPLRYRAPELSSCVSGMPDLQRAHVYTVARVLWECIVGSQAPVAPTGSGARCQVFSGMLPRPAELGIHVSSDVEEVLERALSNDPLERPATLMEFAQRLGASPIHRHACMAELVELVGAPS